MDVERRGEIDVADLRGRKDVRLDRHDLPLLSNDGVCRGLRRRRRRASTGSTGRRHIDTSRAGEAVNINIKAASTTAGSPGRHRSRIPYRRRGVSLRDASPRRPRTAR